MGIGWGGRTYILSLLVLGKVDSPLRDRFISHHLMRRFPEADIYIFGHTHRYFTQCLKGKLVINPGAACATSYFEVMTEATVALLKLEPGKSPQVKKVDVFM